MGEEEGQPTVGASKFQTPHLTSIAETPVISDKLFANPFSKLEHGLKGIEWHQFYFDFYAATHQLKNMVNEHLESQTYLKNAPLKTVEEFNEIYEGGGDGGKVKVIYREPNGKKIPFESTLTVMQLTPITRSQSSAVKVAPFVAQMYQCPYYGDPVCTFKNGFEGCGGCRYHPSYPMFIETRMWSSLKPGTHRLLTNLLKIRIKPSFGRIHSYLSQAVMNKKGGLPWIRGDLRQFGEDRLLWETRHYEGYFVTGNKGSGKTTLLESGGCHYFDQGYLVFDMLGSDVGHENLFWCLDGKGKDSRSYDITLIHPEYVDVKPKISEEYPAGSRIHPVTDKTPLEDILVDALENKRVVCFDNTSYDPDHYRKVLAGYFEDLLRLSDVVRTKKVILIREASKLMPGAQTTDSEEAQISKTAAYYFFQEARHAMTTYIADLQRHSGLFKSARDLMQNWLVKCSNEDIMPEVVSSLHAQLGRYRQRCLEEGVPPYTISKLYPMINSLDRQAGRLNKSRYYQFYSDEMFTLRSNPLPYFRHCGEHDNWSALTGVEFKVDYKLRKKVLSRKIKFDYDKWSGAVVEAVKGGNTLPKDVMEAIDWDGEYTKFLTFMGNLKKMGVVGGMVKDNPKVYLIEANTVKAVEQQVDKQKSFHDYKRDVVERLRLAKGLGRDLKNTRRQIISSLARRKTCSTDEVIDINNTLIELYPESE